MNPYKINTYFSPFPPLFIFPFILPCYFSTFEIIASAECFFFAARRRREIFRGLEKCHRRATKVYLKKFRACGGLQKKHSADAMISKVEK